MTPESQDRPATISNPVGFIVGEAETHRFTFVTSLELAPPRLEYVVLTGARELTAAGPRKVEVLAQVTRLQAASPLLDASHSYTEAQALVAGAYNPPPRILATADVLGYLLREGDRISVRVPRSTPLPGQEVHLAPDWLLREFFTNDVKSGIEAGALVNRPGVPVRMDPNGLRRHLAIIAQTGAGKSYLSGVVLEQLLQLGGTVIVFDPNSDYVRLRYKADSRTERTSFASKVDIYRVPGVEGRRFPDEEIGGSEPYTVHFSELDPDEVCTLAGVSENARNIRHAIRKACESLRLEKQDYSPANLQDRLEKMAGLEAASTPAELEAVRSLEDADDGEPFPEPTLNDRLNAKAGRSPASVKEATGSVKDGAEKAVKYIEDLASYRIWGYQDVNMDRLLQPMKLSVVDLAGMEQYVAQYAVQKTLAEVWRRATTGKLPHPVFVVLEEAHNFVPANNRGQLGECARWINRVASEGRKFKVFLVVITQRPGKIDPDTLSQCGSQVIMKLTNPSDQEAVRRASESLSESLFGDLPGLNTGEAIVVGQLTRVPVMMRVGQRESAEGGSDVDVVKALEAARGDDVTRTIQETGAFGQPDAARRTEAPQEI